MNSVHKSKGCFRRCQYQVDLGPGHTSYYILDIYHIVQMRQFVNEVRLQTENNVLMERCISLQEKTHVNPEL